MARPATGITVRHSRSCAAHREADCPCKPTYVAWVYDPRAKKKVYKSFPTISAAKGWRSDAVPAVRKGTMAAPSKLTVEQAGAAWINGAKAGEILKPDGARYKPAVLRQYGSDLERYVYPAIGGIRVSNLHRRDVQQLVDRFVGQGLSGSRVRGIVMPLRAICRRAIRNDELIVNPTANLELPAAAGTRERVASAQEAAALLAALPEPDRAIWGTAVYAGLRRGELRGLQVDDVDVDARVIHVRRGWDDIEGEIATKSKKGERRVPITADLRLLLLEHLARTGRRGNDLIFGRTPSDPFTPTHVRQRAREAWAATVVGAFFRGQSVAIEPIGLHECRHSFVSLMFDAGFSLERIGDYVGHSSTFMVDRYRHLLEGHEAEAADQFDAYFARRAHA